ncbi:MAG: hypothetical protein K1X92_06790 [Bacteroidia bacterium]|nr:hypothetical protein [Bacteroidia bacterium]
MRLESHKTQPFTDEDVLRYLYAEMNEEESQDFELALEQNENLNERYEEMLDCLAILSPSVAEPKEKQWTFTAFFLPEAKTAPHILFSPCTQAGFAF